MTPAELLSDLSKMVAPYVPALTLTGLAGAWGAGYKRGGSKMRSKLNNERELKRFEEIYAPMYSLFANMHMEGASAIMAPRFKHRWANALDEFDSDNRYRMRAWKRAWHALFDRQISRSVQVTHGSFPIVQIEKLLKGREQYADAKLVRMIQRANASMLEWQSDDDMLTDELYDLYEYIDAQWEALNERFNGKH